MAKRTKLPRFTDTEKEWVIRLLKEGVNSAEIGRRFPTTFPEYASDVPTKVVSRTVAQRATSCRHRYKIEPAIKEENDRCRHQCSDFGFSDEELRDIYDIRPQELLPPLPSEEEYKPTLEKVKEVLMLKGCGYSIREISAEINVPCEILGDWLWRAIEAEIAKSMPLTLTPSRLF